VAGAITPVPGGVGPLTNALLLTHLIRAAERNAASDRDPLVATGGQP
jgi:5,10-methylene-tetrahydrofolate dehydrogenase/methenyl tetrahydrofolate cyclohydrolase